jgi:hypothetical protein
MATTSAKAKGVRWISRREMTAIVDERAKAVLGVSGKTFTTRRRRGDYAHLDADDCPGIVELALLAPSVEVANPRGRKKR